MTLQTSTLRPGLFVALSTTIEGNVTYKRTEIDPDHATADGAREATWQTNRYIANADEDERARVTRSKARSLISGVCAHSRLGLLCPINKEAELESAIADAQRLADDFNTTATLSRVTVAVATFRVEPDEARAVREINKEVRELLAAMANGIGRLDVDAVRDAANKARSLSGMLTDKARADVAVAIKTARDAARKIVQAGDVAAVEIDRVAMRKISEARTAFLDLDTPADVAAPTVDQRALDLEPEDTAAPFVPTTAAAMPSFDF